MLCLSICLSVSSSIVLNTKVDFNGIVMNIVEAISLPTPQNLDRDTLRLFPKGISGRFFFFVI